MFVNGKNPEPPDSSIIVDEAIDRQIVVDVNASGIIPKLYTAARKQACEMPLIFVAGQILDKVIFSKEQVVLVTGYPIPYPFGSNPYEVHSDGPVGVASLARLLSVEFQIRTVIVTDSGLGRVIESCLSASFTRRRNNANMLPRVIEMPFDTDITNECEDIFRKHQPGAIIASEKPSRNLMGEYHAAYGDGLTPFVARADTMFDIATERKIATIAVGDLGNEIGMGNIRETVEDVLDYGGMCRCPCKGGIASSTKASALVLGSMSDWGVYGIIAHLALSKHDSSFIPDETEVRSIMDAFAKATGLQNSSELMTDGIPIDCTLACLKVLRQIVRAALSGKAGSF